ncbi:hypothetical protein JCM5350_000940 [Sporobolomyces pararoseus]
MSNGNYSALPSSSNPLLLGDDSSDQPYLHSPPTGPSPSYPGGEPSTSTTLDSKPSLAANNRPILPPLDNNPESQISFYRSELAYVREENQKLQDKIESLKQQELQRLRDQVSNSGLFKFFIIFFGSFVFALSVIYLITK